ncbi:MULTISPECIES: hypothetical protein [unclassified Lentimicrobium]|uniref:hypothetical protein n=1 Tax=unclassified Lentimicrobium TaxID=2677434 RepID=UPI001554130E|nr:MULTISPECIES: hypothetical protein [unclassified Lentimicrobium]NPD45063.1 hypothetical protein [Lentimicrobium sp. S6]NPD84539.1 hypothetical protein [Lentimicrobium sp. L6]
MKNIYLLSTKLILIVIIVFSGLSSMAQTEMSREEIALQKAEDKVEANRVKLVTVKRQIESADSLFVAGEQLDDAGKLRKMAARDQVKAIEKQYKTDSKPLNKAAKSKDRAEVAAAKVELRELTTKYKADLKLAQNEIKAGDKDMSTAVRMMDKADKKLDLLSKKLKTYEDAYEDAEKALNAKKEGK